MRVSSTGVRVARYAVCCGLALTAAASQVRAADVLSHWNGGIGDWTNLLNWTHTPSDLGADYPNNGLLTYDAEISDGELTLDSAITLEHISISSGRIGGLGSLSLNQGFNTSGSLVRIGLPQITLRGPSSCDANTEFVSGSVRLLSTLTINGNTTISGSLEMTNEPYAAPMINGPANVYVGSGGKLLWAGLLTGSGETIVLAGGALELSPDGSFRKQHTLINEAGNNIQWNFGLGIWCDGGRILNRGSLTVANSMTIGRDYFPATSPMIDNEGTFRISSTNGPIVFDQVAFTNRGDVLIESSTLRFAGTYVQTSGRTLIKSSSIGTYPGCDLLILGGDFSVDGAIDCRGLRVDSTLSIAPGSVINAGQLLLTNTSVIEFELGPSGSGLINQTEWGWLDGTFRLRLANGFMPAVGTRYTLFTHLAPITQFPRHEGLEIGNGLRLVPHYTGDELEVVVMNAPQPGQTALTVKRIPAWAPPTLSWPPEYAGFYFQYTTNLNNPDWTTLFVTWTNAVNISTSERQGFFRLLQP